MRIWMFALLAATAAFAQQDEYHGPEPPKADVPYLLHASTLVETQTGEAKEESKKGGPLFWVEGATSTARPPLAEPIFILKASKLNPDKLELYKFDVVKGRLIRDHGYDEESATDVLNYVASIFARGDVKK